MKRLPSSRRDWTRIQWHSQKARDVWEPRINKINGMWNKIERESVCAGIRDSYLTSLKPIAIPEQTEWCVQHGLVLLPLAQVGFNATYATSLQEVKGNDWQYRVVMTRPALAQAWFETWNNMLHPEQVVTFHDVAKAGVDLGVLLGYPQCCREFFHRTWVEQQYVDTTWPMALDTQVESDPNVSLLKVEGPLECSTLLRWLGVRCIPHLPCSFHCAETVVFAEKFIELAMEFGFEEEVDWTREMLSWPVEWSALHGIALIKLPILEISSSTDATPEKYTVQYNTASDALYPTEGVSGLRFPYRNKQRVLVSKTTAFKYGLEQAGKTRVSVIDENEWLHNGFGSKQSMNEHHKPILETLQLHWSFKDQGCVLDLGCGNGLLLELICTKFSNLQPCGVEYERERAAAAYTRLGHCGEIAFGNLTNLQMWDRSQYDLILFMPGRLIELTTEEATAVRKQLQQKTKTCLFYGYVDNLKHAGDLQTLIEKADLLTDWEIVSPEVNNEYSAAVMVQRKEKTDPLN